MVASMPLDIAGVRFLTNGEVAEHARVSRQTLWRWRAEGRIPAGRQYRGRAVVFTEEEVEAILQYANRIEPLSAETRAQLGLFESSPKGGSR